MSDINEIDTDVPTDDDLMQACSCSAWDESDVHKHSLSCALWEVDGWVMGHIIWHDHQLLDTDQLAALGEADADEMFDDMGWWTEDDAQFECTCYPEGEANVHLDTSHHNDCDLHFHEAWTNSICDWDHQTRTFIYKMDPAILQEDDNEAVTAELVECSCTPPKVWCCMKCDVHRVDEHGPWLPRSQPLSGTKGMSTSGSNDSWSYMSDRHYGESLTFPNDVTVYPSSHFSRKASDDVPDHAIYLDNCWAAWSCATYIPWRDMGLPEVPFQRAAEAIIDGYVLASQGQSVEIGCIGGHGRTGTVLACMAVLAGVPATDAVAWVRKHYCNRAVESARQEWYVLWFNAYVNNEQAPPMPPPPAPWKPAKKDEKKEAKDNKKGKKAGADAGAGWHGRTDDLKVGDACPDCGQRLVDDMAVVDYNGLTCLTTTCKKYKNLPRCTLCDVYLDAHNLWQYGCWNNKCKAYAVERGTPKFAQLLEAATNAVRALSGVKTSK